MRSILRVTLASFAMLGTIAGCEPPDESVLDSLVKDASDMDASVGDAMNSDADAGVADSSVDSFVDANPLDSSLTDSSLLDGGLDASPAHTETCFNNFDDDGNGFIDELCANRGTFQQELYAKAADNVSFSGKWLAVAKGNLVNVYRKDDDGVWRAEISLLVSDAQLSDGKTLGLAVWENNLDRLAVGIPSLTGAPEQAVVRIYWKRFDRWLQAPDYFLPPNQNADASSVNVAFGGAYLAASFSYPLSPSVSRPGRSVFLLRQNNQDFLFHTRIDAPSGYGSCPTWGNVFMLGESGNSLAVGCPDETSGLLGQHFSPPSEVPTEPVTATGSVNVFRNRVDSWTHEVHIRPERDALGPVGFGTSVALNDNGNNEMMVIGAALQSEIPGLSDVQGAGAVHVYRKDRFSNRWTKEFESRGTRPEHSLFAPVRAGMGSQVLFEHYGTHIVVSAPGSLVSPATQSGVSQNFSHYVAGGSVYAFDYINDSWQQTANFASDCLTAGDGFGTRLSGNAYFFAAFSPGEDSNATGLNGDQSNDSAENTGAAFVFRPTL